MIQFGDIQNAAIAKTLLMPQAVTQTTTTTHVDMGAGIGGQGGMTMLLNIGAVSGTGGPSCDIKLQECATTDGTYTDISGATFAQLTTGSSGVTTGNNNASIKTIFNRGQRYVRAVLTIAGTTSPSFTLGLSLLEMKRNTGT